jgi:ATP-dependent Lon protease
VRIPGYGDAEKREIARRYLVPRQIVEYGLTPAECRFDSAAVEMLIQSYTREAGVVNLERHVASLCRAAVAALATNKERARFVVSPAVVEDVLGPPRYLREPRLSVANVGVVTGLAWTSVGGEIMLIEALLYPGKGMIQLTGQIGGVMKESAHAALSLLKTRAVKLGIKESDILDNDLHVHVPAGAVPKDGPSAGVAIFTAIASLWTGRAVRADVAMTGEITLRGLVLPIGGLKEKILAAQRAGILTVVIPKLNEKDLADLPVSIRQEMNTVLVETVDEVLAASLMPQTAAAPKKGRRNARRKSTEIQTPAAEPMAAAVTPTAAPAPVQPST